MRRPIIIIIVLIVLIAFFLGLHKSKNKSKPGAMPASGQAAVMLKDAKALAGKNDDQAIAKLNKLVADFSGSPQAPEALMETAKIYDSKSELLKEQDTLKELLNKYPKASIAKEAQKKLWDVNVQVILSPIQTKDSMEYQVAPGDSLYKIAKKFHTNVELIQKSNNIKGTLIRPGMKLKICKAKFKIHVDKSDRTLTLLKDGEVVKVYDVAVGRDNSTPVGKFKVINRILNPVWYRTGAIVPSGSPENILGPRWLGLSEPGYGIHGTTVNKPIGEQSTEGCVRMLNAQVEELFTIVPVGTEVEITD